MKKRRLSMKPRLKIFIFLLLMGYFFHIAVEQEILFQKQYEEMTEIQQQIAEVMEQNRELERQIEYTNSAEYIEKLARERLGWVKDNEIVFKEKKH